MFDKGDTEDLQALTEKIRRLSPEAVMVLAPNRFHAPLASVALRLDYPTFVEKPLVTTAPDLESLARVTEANPLLYCSDFYSDVRAVPLRLWFGDHLEWAIKALAIEGETSLWLAGPTSIGKIHKVDSVLIEAGGSVVGFEGREWLWDPVHGGVLWDLAYHYLVLYQFLFAENVSLVKSQFRFSPDAPVAPAGETYAHLEMTTRSEKQFDLRAGKCEQGKTERWFKLQGTKGMATMTFGETNYLEIVCGSKFCRAELRGNYYKQVSEAFAW